jgi:hypothetical protein
MAGVRLNTGGGFASGFASGMAMLGDKSAEGKSDAEAEYYRAKSASLRDEVDARTAAANVAYQQQQGGLAEQQAAEIRASIAAGAPVASVNNTVSLSGLNDAKSNEIQAKVDAGTAAANVGLTEAQAAERNANAQSISGQSSRLTDKHDHEMFQANAIRVSDLTNQMMQDLESIDPNLPADEIMSRMVATADRYEKMGKKYNLREGKFQDMISADRIMAMQKLTNAMGRFNPDAVRSRDGETYSGDWREEDASEDLMAGVERDIVDSINVLTRGQIQKGNGKNKKITSIIPIPSKAGEKADKFSFGIRSEDDEGNVRESPVSVGRGTNDPARVYDMNRVMDYYGAEKLLQDSLVATSRNIWAKKPLAQRQTELNAAISKEKEGYDKARLEIIKAYARSVEEEVMSPAQAEQLKNHDIELLHLDMKSRLNTLEESYLSNPFTSRVLPPVFFDSVRDPRAVAAKKAAVKAAAQQTPNVPPRPMTGTMQRGGSGAPPKVPDTSSEPTENSTGFVGSIADVISNIPNAIANIPSAAQDALQRGMKWSTEATPEERERAAKVLNNSKFHSMSGL